MGEFTDPTATEKLNRLGFDYFDQMRKEATACGWPAHPTYGMDASGMSLSLSALVQGSGLYGGADPQMVAFAFAHALAQFLVQQDNVAAAKANFFRVTESYLAEIVEDMEAAPTEGNA